MSARCWRTVAPVAIAMIGATTAALAQADAVDPARPNGRNWDLGLFVGYGKRSADGTIIIDRAGPGSGAATAQSLGLGDATDPQLAVDSRWKRWYFGLNHSPTVIDGQGFAVATLELGDVSIAVDTPVSTAIDVELDLLGIRYAVTQTEATTLNVGAGLGRTTLDIDLSPGIGEGIRTDTHTPFGFLTLELRQRLGERWLTRFAVNGAVVTRGDDELAYFDFDVSGAYRIMDRSSTLDVVAGFRLINFTFDYPEQDSALLVDVQLRGPYLGLRAAF